MTATVTTRTTQPVHRKTGPQRRSRKSGGTRVTWGLVVKMDNLDRLSALSLQNLVPLRVYPKTC